MRILTLDSAVLPLTARFTDLYTSRSFLGKCRFSTLFLIDKTYIFKQRCQKVTISIFEHMKVLFVITTDNFLTKTLHITSNDRSFDCPIIFTDTNQQYYFVHRNLNNA